MMQFGDVHFKFFEVNIGYELSMEAIVLMGQAYSNIYIDNDNIDTSNRKIVHSLCSLFLIYFICHL